MNRIQRRRRLGLAPIALAPGALLTVSSLQLAAPTLAAGDTLWIESPSNIVAVGGTFTIRVVANASVDISGSQTSIVFDSIRLQLQSIAKGADWVDNGAGFAGYPSAANMATFIANANAAGKLSPIATFFSDGSSLPAGDHDLLRVTFAAIACGDSTIDLPVGPTDASLIDGRPATYGDALAVTTTGGSVTVPCGAGAPAPPGKPSPSDAGPGQASPLAGTCPMTLRVKGDSTVHLANVQAKGPFEVLWAPGTSVDLASTSTTWGMDNLQAGNIEVAGNSRGLTAAQQAYSYVWKIGTAGGPTSLYLAVRKPTVASRIDNTALVRGDDFVNYMLSAAGQAHVAAAGFSPVPVPASRPIPDFDANLDGAVGLADIGNLIGRWGQTSSCPGWIRADVNNDGAVGLGDIGRVTAKWGGTGFVAPPIMTASTGECGELQPVNRWSGWIESGTFHGVRGALHGRPLDVCSDGFLGTGEWRGSSAWVNIVGPGNLDIVQLGRGRCYGGLGPQCDGVQDHIWAWGRGSCGGFIPKLPTIVNLGPAPAVSETYIVQHNPLSWAGYLNGSLMAEVDNTEICWAPTSAQWFAETWDAGDALGGSAEDHYRFSNMAVQPTQGGGYQSLSLNPGPNCNIREPEAMYHCDILTTNSFESWTAR